MSLDFVQKFDSLSHRLLRWGRAAAVCRAIVQLAVSLLVLAAIDWSSGVNVRGWRVLISVAAAAAIALIVARLIRSFRPAANPLQMALEVERRHPQLGDLLSSGVAFSAQDPSDPTAGSLELRRGVVVRASQAADDVELDALLPRRELRAAAMGALASLAAAAVFALMVPETASVAARRLSNPLAAAEWPREHDLKFVDAPSVVAVGGEFRTRLTDRHGKLPASIVVEYRSYAPTGWQHEQQMLTPERGAKSVEVVRSAVEGPFEYRATGGDHHSMAWQTVGTAPAAEVRRLRVSEHPPAYTGLSPRELESPYRVLKGSQVQFRARLSRAASRAQLVSRDREPIDLAVDAADRRAVIGAWTPDESTEWQIRVTSVDGATAPAGQPLSIMVAPDQAPRAVIVNPVGDVHLLASAAVALEVAAEDDIALRAVSIRARRRTSSPPPPLRSGPVETHPELNDAFSMELYRGPEEASPAQPAETEGQEVSPRQRSFQPVLDLAELGGAPGEAWEVTAAAADYAGQTSKPAVSLTITIISREEFERRVEESLNQLGKLISETHHRQQDAADRVTSWGDDVSAISSDEAWAALGSQTQVARALDANQGGALAVLTQTLIEYVRNGLADDDEAVKLAGLQKPLSSLVADVLPEIEAGLSQMAGAAQRADRAAKLQAVTSAQRRSLAVLEEALVQLNRWRRILSLQRSLTDAKVQQQQLHAETVAAARENLANNSTDADADERRTETLGARQRELAVRLDGLMSRMRGAQQELAAEHPEDAERIAGAIAVAEELSLQAAAREAGVSLVDDRLTTSADEQGQVVDVLTRMIDRLNADGGDGSERQLAALRSAEAKLAELGKRVAELAAEQQRFEQRDEAQREAQSGLSDERRQLAEGARRAAADIANLPAPGAAKAAQRAADELRQDDPRSASDRAAEEALRDAERQIASQRRDLEAMIARKKLSELGAAVDEMVEAQSGVAADVAALVHAQPDGAAGSRQREAESLAARQADVRQRTTALADGARVFPVFAALLERIAGEMQAAEQELHELELGESVLAASERPLESLKMLAESLREQARQQREFAANSSTATSTAQRTPQQQQAAQRAQALRLAIGQLVLLRKMESDLADRTAELERRRTQGDLSEEEVATRSAALGQDQRRVAELAEALVRQTELPTNDATMPEAEGILPELPELEE